MTDEYCGIGSGADGLYTVYRMFRGIGFKMCSGYKWGFGGAGFRGTDSGPKSGLEGSGFWCVLSSTFGATDRCVALRV